MLVPYTPRPKEWGSWQIRLLYATSTVVSPHAVHKQVNQEQKEDKLGTEEEGELAYDTPSPNYSPLYPPEFYEDE